MSGQASRTKVSCGTDMDTIVCKCHGRHPQALLVHPKQSLNFILTGGRSPPVRKKIKSMYKQGQDTLRQHYRCHRQPLDNVPYAGKASACTRLSIARSLSSNPVPRSLHAELMKISCATTNCSGGHGTFRWRPARKNKSDVTQGRWQRAQRFSGRTDFYPDS